MAGDSKDLRLFLAIGLADLFQGPLERFLEVSSRQFPGIKWVKAAQVHVTLHFFGSTPQEKIPQIREVLLKHAASCLRFEIQLCDFGCFPSKNQPRILWIGLGGNVEALESLQKTIEEALKNLGFPVEGRPFQPHVTVGRVKNPLSVLEIQKLMQTTFSATELKIVDRMALMKSCLTPAGPEYEIIETIPLS